MRYKTLRAFTGIARRHFTLNSLLASSVLFSAALITSKMRHVARTHGDTLFESIDR
jgi:hypothetical protein